MTACLMAYNGWSYVSFVAGEVSNPQRNLLRSLVFGMTGVAALYIFANVAYLRVMTIPELAATERVGADLATRTMGSIGGSFVALTVLLSIAGAVNGCVSDGRPPAVRAGAGPAVLRALRRSPSPFSDTGRGHCVERRLDGGSDSHRLL